MSEKTLKIYGYVRVSTEDQAKEGISLDAQSHKIKAFADLHGLELLGIIEDIASAKTLKRQGMKKLLDIVQKNETDGIVVYKLDRLTRSTKDLLFLMEDHFKNIAFFSVSEAIDTKTPFGRFFLTLSGALAQMERENTAERTASIMAFKEEKGEHIGHAPYGYDILDKKLIKNPQEQEIIAKIIRWKREGLSLRAIAEKLNKKGIKTKRGSLTWSHKTLAYLLQKRKVHRKSIEK